ncbi:TPA: EexN family lipoprotein [Yersinia enterocolitica]|nr:EexN family lipoprotein [Yersinia enterocolitica]HDL6666383.1 EexN family lipoprotein [Yersinia enterocolitica]HDL6695648.1 EexN family lipoprotein [Yersinia enterocolitica]HDL6713608.1 EexN family lipoprotein [Yersinia enterocolitica]HDL6757201.1 EexN family lipoprotein [Yersinia enterocolitica]
MKKMILSVLVISTGLLAGCQEETKSIKWYVDHPDETYTVYSKCLKTGSGSQNCENAKRGARSLSVSRDAEVQKRFQEFFPPAPIPTFN